MTELGTQNTPLSTSSQSNNKPQKTDHENRVTIATRQSPLALWQAEHVKAVLERIHPGLKVELLTFVTKGDKILDAPLAKIGGKGLFVKELENALFEHKADMAVHSMKDVPMELPKGLTLDVICERESPWDCLISSSGKSILDLPAQSVIGTSSLRRQCQLRNLRPDLVVKDLRGNINTRLGKLDAGEYDAIILAGAGMERMKFDHRISQILTQELFLPAVGQGALGIEVREDDLRVQALIEPLNCIQTHCIVTAERAMNHRLMGGCQVPIAGYAELLPKTSRRDAQENGLPDNLSEKELYLKGLVGQIDGSTLYRAEARHQLTDSREQNHAIALQTGIQVAEELLNLGAGEVLNALR